MGAVIRIDSNHYRLYDLPGYTGDHPVLQFAKEWISGTSSFDVQTSGSTGTPKKITLSRKAMECSAKRTLDYFGLKSGEKALLCMNPHTIGGKMMVVRALIGELELVVVQPSANPFSGLSERFDFIPMVPLQLQTLLRDTPSDHPWRSSGAILLGGAQVSEPLQLQITKLSVAVYQGYGMTETCSHIAMRRLNGKGSSDDYMVMRGIECSLNPDHCLSIRGDVTDYKWLDTTDLVTFTRYGHFLWTGRKDFIINSGGYKVSPEPLEQQIGLRLRREGNLQPVMISWVPDEKWGQKVVAVTEGQPLFGLDWLRETLQDGFRDWELPKELFWVEKFSLNANNKIDREATRSQLKEWSSK